MKGEAGGVGARWRGMSRSKTFARATFVLVPGVATACRHDVVGTGCPRPRRVDGWFGETAGWIAYRSGVAVELVKSQFGNLRQ